MIFIGAPKVSTNSLSKLMSGKQSISFDHVALAVDPFGLNRVQPGTFRREKERQDAHAFALLLDLLVVLPNPGANLFTVMPGSIIPDQEPDGFALLSQLLAAPIEKLGGDVTHGASGNKTQRHLFAHRMRSRSLLPEHSIAGERFGIRITFLPGLLDQAQWIILILPGVKLR